jgi:hypothetical protein
MESPLRPTKQARPGEYRNHRVALAIFREIGDQDGKAWALNGLGEGAHAAGRDSDAAAHHTAACTVATESGARDQQDRAQAGLRHAYGTTDSQCHAIRKTNRSS